MKETIIKVKELVKNYGNFQAVKGISFDVHEGEIFGLLGPNGAGKSTTLEIIETLREKTSGEVWVNGFNLDKDPDEIKKIIGVQLQTSGYYPNLKLVELITLFNGLYNRDADPMSLLEMVNLKDKANSKVKELSGGQKQRFSVATTLINDPKIVFLDEPTTGLHFDDIAKLLAAVRKLVEAGHTLVVIEHNLDVIKTADYIIDLGPEGGEAGGKVVTAGTPEQVAQVESSYTGRALRRVLATSRSTTVHAAR